jgi:NADH:ubiquinone oxidoreductase subunit 2 (subunit N)
MLSILVGSILTLRQLEIKKFLAYSSITHVGFMLIGDLQSSLLYVLVYVASTLLMFSILLSAKSKGFDLNYLSDFRHLKISHPLQLLYLIIALASMAGLPPFAGFYGKFLI